jgi:hypothetical protein
VTQSHTKTYGIRQKAPGAVTDAQLQAINAYTLREFGADEVAVREFVLAHNCIDRDKECFDEALLTDFARTLPGKGVFIKHPRGWDGDSGPGEGRVFASSVEQMTLDAARALLKQPALVLPPDRSMVSVLKSSAYFARTSENDALLTKMDAGIVSDVSIGFTATDYVRLKGADGIELNAWRIVGPGEALEQSLVWLGAQPGARAIKHATRSTEANDMDLQKDLDTANARIKTLEGEKAAGDAATATINAVKAALGDNAALVDSPAQLAALVGAGKAHRDALVDQLVAADRTKGLVGDDEAAVKAARDEYAAMPITALERLGKHAAAPAAAPAAAVTGSDPNAERPGTKGAPTGIFANPLIGGAAAATA